MRVQIGEVRKATGDGTKSLDAQAAEPASHQP